MLELFTVRCRPADLKTMSKRVDSELYYVTLDMFTADVKRMFQNARTYNSPETIYYKCATRHDTPFSLIFRNCTLAADVTYYQLAGWKHMS